MFTSQDKINPNQIAIALVSIMIGGGILAMPSVFAAAAARDGWLSILLAGADAALAVYCLTLLGKTFPSENILEYSSRLLGKKLGFVVGIVFLVFFLLSTAMAVRQFGDVLKIYFLEKTPLEVINLTMLFTSAYLVGHGVNSMFRVMQTFFPLLIIPIVLLLLMALPMANFKEVLPLFEQGAVPIFKGSIVGYGIFGGYSIIGFFIPYLSKAEKAVIPCLGAQALVIIIYLAMFLIALAVFGPIELSNSLFPIVDLVRLIEVPGTFIERFDIIILSIWILAVFTTVVAVYFLSATTLTHLTGLGELRCWVFLLLPFIYLIAMTPQNIDEVSTFGKVVGDFSLGLTFYIEILILLALKHIKEAKQK
ncbi:endospore germination permease [Bacillota bacterium LX-D]|nr:endospore germination permease [Bacillota bacterium LX-D]